MTSLQNNYKYPLDSELSLNQWQSLLGDKYTMQHIKNQKNIFFLCNQNHAELNNTFFNYLCKQPADNNSIGNQVFFQHMYTFKISHTAMEAALDNVWWPVREHERARFVWGGIHRSNILDKYEFIST